MFSAKRRSAGYRRGTASHCQPHCRRVDDRRQHLCRRVLRDKLGFGVYNVHTGFDPANTEQLAALLKTHDARRPDGSAHPEGFCKLRRELDAQPTGFLDSRIRRFQSFAEISTEPGPHFGLGLEAYATGPRRSVSMAT